MMGEIHPAARSRIVVCETVGPERADADILAIDDAYRIALRRVFEDTSAASRR